MHDKNICWTLHIHAGFSYHVSYPESQGNEMLKVLVLFHFWRQHWNFAFDSGHLVFNYSSAKNGTGSGSDSAVPQRVGSNGSLKGAATAAKGLCDLCVKHWAAGLTLMSGQMAGVLVCFVYCFKCMCTVCQQDCNEGISSLHFLVHPSVTGTSNIF